MNVVGHLIMGLNPVLFSRGLQFRLLSEEFWIIMDDATVLIIDVKHLGAFVNVKSVKIQPIFGKEIVVDIAEISIFGKCVFAMIIGCKHDLVKN
jgi:hypothetical protein